MLDWSNCAAVERVPGKVRLGHHLLSAAARGGNGRMMPNDPKLSHCHRRLERSGGRETAAFFHRLSAESRYDDSQSSSLNPKLEGQWPLAPARFSALSSSKYA